MQIKHACIGGREAMLLPLKLAAEPSPADVAVCDPGANNVRSLAMRVLAKPVVT
jgi:hypothetical protein